MNPATVFTEKYFYEELGRFRQAMADKTWWARPEQDRDAWVSGLAFVYLQIQNDDGSNPTREQIDKWAMIFNATMREYNRRMFYMTVNPPK